MLHFNYYFYILILFFSKDVFFMFLDDFSHSVFHRLNHVTTNLDNSIHKHNSIFKNTFVDNFVHELNDYLFKETSISRLKQLPRNTLFRITEDNTDYIICSVDSISSNTNQKYDCNFISNDTYYIPKSICTISNISLYKTENTISEETHYQNYLQLNGDTYQVVDKN